MAYFRGVCRISQGGAQLENLLDLGYTCREQRSCEPVLGEVWGHAPPIKLLKMVQFCAF